MVPDPLANASLDGELQRTRAKLEDAVEATAVAVPLRSTRSGTPGPDTVELSRQKRFSIAFPPQDAAAQDDELVIHITDFVNRIYYDAEASFWKPGFARTHPGEIRDYLQSGVLALAWRQGSSYEQHGDLGTDLLGCVEAKTSASEQEGEFGMLACEPSSRGVGLGRELLRFAEDEIRRRGAKTIRLGLLQGDGWTHEFKDRLEGWYMRNGYRLVEVGQVKENFAGLAPMLAKPTVMKIFVKQL